MNDQQQKLHDLSKLFLERANILEYKGKKLDIMALEFFTGAAALEELQTKKPTGPWLWLISFRGVMPVREWAAGRFGE